MDRKRAYSEEEQPRKRVAIEKSDSEHSEQTGRESHQMSSSSQESGAQESESDGESGEQSSPSQQSRGSQHESEAEESEQSLTSAQSRGIVQIKVANNAGHSSVTNRSSHSSYAKHEFGSSGSSSHSQSAGSSQRSSYGSQSSHTNQSTSSSHSTSASSSSSGESFIDEFDNNYLDNEDYSIIKEIGSGSYGYVYQAENTQTNQIVAIKVLKDGKKFTTLAVIDRLNETTLRLIDIPYTNIVTQHSCEGIDVLQSQCVHRLYICSEFTELPDLFEALQIRNNSGNQIWWPLDEHQSRHMIKGIASGVRHMHSNGMSHSDLKPDNVLLFWSNNATQQHRNASMNDILTRNKYLIYELIPKLTDFDKCATRSDDDPEGKIMVTRVRSQQCYAAPECYKGVRYDLIKADCYSVGCCLMAMLLASHPFDDKTFEGITSPQDIDPLYREKLQKKLDHCNRMKGDVSYIRQLIEHLSPQLRQVLEKLLDPNSDSRITMNQFLSDQWFSQATEGPNKPKRYTDFGRTYLQDV